MGGDTINLSAAGHELSSMLASSQAQVQQQQQRLEALETWKGYTDTAGHSVSEVLQYMTADIAHLRRRLAMIEQVCA